MKFISQEEYQKTEQQSLSAQEFLKDERFQFIIQYIKEAKQYCEDTILNNNIKDVEEVVTLSQTLQKIFKTPKKVQLDELKGQYKWINKFINDLHYYASLKKQLDEDINKGLVKIK